MNDPNQGTAGGTAQGAQAERQSFIDQADRPEVRLDPEMPVSQMRVRDLAVILGSVALKPIRLEKFFKQEKTEKQEIKELKPEKFEKNEKLEWEKLDKAPGFESPFDPGQFQEPDPHPWREVVQVVSGLQQQVSQLANQVAELQRKIGQ